MNFAFVTTKHNKVIFSKFFSISLRSATISNFPIREDDTFLLSYPKSGNTWMRFLLTYLMKGGQLEYEELETYIPSVYVSADKIPKIASPRILKTHHVFLEKYPKVVYIVRDGRDALVSYYHFYQDTRNFKGTFKEFYDVIQKSDIGTWKEHVAKAVRFKEESPERILIVRYEDMKLDTASVLRQVVDFLGMENINEELIKSSVEASHFDRLRAKQEKKGGILINGKNVNFFRKGQSGNWGTYFSEELLNHFYEENGDLLSRWKYDY